MPLWAVAAPSVSPSAFRATNLLRSCVREGPSTPPFVESSVWFKNPLHHFSSSLDPEELSDAGLSLTGSLENPPRTQAPHPLVWEAGPEDLGSLLFPVIALFQVIAGWAHSLLSKGRGCDLVPLV